jgi:hypothetical protein
MLMYTEFSRMEFLASNQSADDIHPGLPDQEFEHYGSATLRGLAPQLPTIGQPALNHRATSQSSDLFPTRDTSPQQPQDPQTISNCPSLAKTSSGPPSGTRKRKAPTLRVEDWEPYKARIIELHIEQDLPLRKVKDAIQKEFGFEAEYVCSGIASERGSYS